MIRLPLTSIDVSALEVEEYMHDADVFRALLKQGFTRKEIVKYFANKHRAEGRKSLDEDVEAICGMLDTVQLISQRTPTSLPLHTFKDEDQPPNADFLRTSTRNVMPCDLDINRHGNDIVALAGRAQFKHVASGCGSRAQDGVSESTGPDSDEIADNSTNLFLQSYQHERLISHTPRQSSLLRFSKVVTPDKSAAASRSKRPEYKLESRSVDWETNLRINNTDDQEPKHVASLSLNCSTSLRSDEIRDLETHALESAAHINSVASKNPQYSTAGGYGANEPCEAGNIIPKSASGSPITNQDISSSPPCEVEAEIIQKHFHTLQVPSLRSLEDDGGDDDDGAYTSSDEAHGDTAFAVEPHLGDVLSLATPVRARVATRTRESHRKSRNTMMVYDDALPPDIQPQTPMDLNSRQFISQQVTSYAETPGTILTSFQSRNTGRQTRLSDAGEMSPTQNSFRVHRGRDRELERDTRVESLHPARFRRR